MEDSSIFILEEETGKLLNPNPVQTDKPSKALLLQMMGKLYGLACNRIFLLYTFIVLSYHCIILKPLTICAWQSCLPMMHQFQITTIQCRRNHCCCFALKMQSAYFPWAMQFRYFYFYLSVFFPFTLVDVVLMALHSIQGTKKIINKKKFSSNCCFASLIHSSSDEIGLILVFSNGKIEIR